MNRQNSSKPRFAWTAIVALAAVCLVLPAVANAQTVAEMRAGSSGVDFHPLVGYGSLVLTVSGPDGYSFRAEFGGGESPFFSIFDQAGGVLPDGNYNYELQVVPTSQQRRDAFEANQAATKSRGGVEPLIQSGAFSIAGGAIVAGDATEPGQHGPQANPLATKTTILTTADGSILNSLCVGSDCTSSESFGFDTLRLKENNTRIKFQDTSVGSFPSNDWELTANDSSNGGQNRFSILDVDAGRNLFTAEAGAGANSIYIDSSGNVGGNVGFGTSTPVVDLHVVSGNTPTLRLEQNASSGFAAQTWDVAGNETNFFVRDTTNGSKIPFKIIPSAPSNSLYVASSGNVGIGTASPSAALDVRRTDAAPTSLLVENTNATAQVVTMTLDNTATDLGSWEFRVAGNGSFFINDTDSTGQVLRILAATGAVLIPGDLTVNGTFSNPSSRTLKTNVEPVDPTQILQQVASLPINEWTYIKDESKRRHIGPFTEDFGRLFGLGTKGKNIIPLDVQGVTLAAVQGLYQTVQALQEEVAALKAGNCSIEDNE